LAGANGSHLYQSTVDEPVPQHLLDIVGQLSDVDSVANEALKRAEKWRGKAEEFRIAAESTMSEHARRELLQVACD